MTADPPEKPSEEQTLSPEELQAGLETMLAALPAPSEREQERIAEAVERGSERPPRVEARFFVKTESGVTIEVAPVHSDMAGWRAHLSDAFGTADSDEVGRCFRREVGHAFRSMSAPCSD